MSEQLKNQSLRGKRVLLTGINGFLGKHVAKNLLENGAHPVGLVRQGSNLSDLDAIGALSDSTILEMSTGFENLDSLVERANAEVVIHIASASRVKEDSSGIREMIAANVLFPSLLLESMTRHRVNRFINVGSSWQSCNGNGYSPFNFYAATKQAIEDIAESFVSHGIHVTTLRLFDTYGQDDTRSKILNLIIRHTLTGLSLDMSPGQQKIHLVHVDDAAAALVSLCTAAHDGKVGHYVYDLPSLEAISLRALAENVEKIIGKPCPINWGGRPYRQHEIMEPLPANRPPPDFKLTRSLLAELPSIIAVQTERLRSE